MMGRDHVLTGALALELAAAAGTPLIGDPAAVIAASGLFLWGTLAPDLDSEDSVASAAYAPRKARVIEPGRFVPRARPLVRYLIPGSHTLSAACRVSARWWYRETRGAQDPEGDDPHRRGWHTLWGALILGGIIALLLSGAIVDVIAQVVADNATHPDAGPTTRALEQLFAQPHALEVGRRLLAAPWVGLCAGTAAMAWWGDKRMPIPLLLIAGPRLRWKVAAWWTGALSAFLVSDLAGDWPLWVAAVVAGCFLHCLGDRCTVGGIASFLAPLTSRRDQRWSEGHLTPRVMRFRTGSGGEALFVIGLFLVVQGVVWVILSGRGILPPAVDAFVLLERAGTA
jgi:hypothetical protein